jgi:Domain of unknown function (DUF4294)
MRKLILLPSLLLLCFATLMAQSDSTANGAQKPRKGLFTKEDSLLYGGQLPTINIFENDLEQYKSDMLKIRVLRVAQYVETGKQIMIQIEANKQNEKKKNQKKYIKDEEKILREKFEDELKNLSINDGQVLVKLINRETGNNCYKLISQLKGGFTAFFYQQVGKRYGYDLKQGYDPKEEKQLELVIKQVQQQGQLLTLKPSMY